MDCRRVDVGVIGDRKESTTSSGGCGEESACLADEGIEYVKFVVDASKEAPS